MSARTWSLVCYDVRDDRRLRKVAKLLEGRGERIQDSVFRVRLSAHDEERLRWDLTKLTEVEDSWIIIPLCASCSDRVRRRDRRGVWGDDPPRVTIL